MQVTTRWITNQRYDVTMGPHEIPTDQPVTEGGEHAGPSPVELLLGAIGGCAAFYAGAYLANKGVDRKGLEVTVTGETAQRPYRFASFKVEIRLPPDTDPKLERPVARAVKACTVFNTLNNGAEFDTSVVTKSN